TDISPCDASRGCAATSALSSLDPYRPVIGTPYSSASCSRLAACGAKLAKPTCRSVAKSPGPPARNSCTSALLLAYTWVLRCSRMARTVRAVSYTGSHTTGTPRASAATDLAKPDAPQTCADASTHALSS